MDKIRIRKANYNGFHCYELKPVNYIENLHERLLVVPGIAYNSVAQCWTFPPLQENIKTLEGVFGIAGLIWEPKRNSLANPSSVNAPVRRNDHERFQPQYPANSPRKPYPKQNATNDAQPLAKHWQYAYHRAEEQLRARRYSPNTIKSYLNHLKHFLGRHPDLQLDEISNEVIRSYIVARTYEGNYSESTQGQMLNALKFWLEKVEGREKSFYDLRPKKKKRLPTVLSVEEVVRLLNAVDNLKHRCILKTIYSGGLRLSEVTNLRIADVHSDRMQLFIHGGKGKKDRYTTLSKGLLVDLRAYFVEYQPEYWLFEGQTGGQYSNRSVQAVLRKAVVKSRINPYTTVHTLRHSYATHLLEQGTSLRHIQLLLGHESSTTTEIYTHVSNHEKQQVISPLDRLDGLK